MINKYSYSSYSYLYSYTQNLRISSVLWNLRKTNVFLNPINKWRSYWKRGQGRVLSAALNVQTSVSQIIFGLKKHMSLRRLDNNVFCLQSATSGSKYSLVIDLIIDWYPIFHWLINIHSIKDQVVFLHWPLYWLRHNTGFLCGARLVNRSTLQLPRFIGRMQVTEAFYFKWSY